jgi:phosphoglycolate phosphatase-like HAD superfamily hydrolase
MKFPIILTDHDDTAVDSTPTIHHPAHVEQMKRLGMESHIKSVEDWFRINYDPGLHHFMNEELRLDEEQQKLCYEIWRRHTAGIDPPFFEGILELLSEVTRRGGSVFVVSHSEETIISRHYRNQSIVPGFHPRGIYGWTGDPEKAKPGVWPVEDIISRYGFRSEEMIMIDDLKPGITMARNAGISSIGAAWSHAIGEIREDLGRIADVVFESVDEAAAWLLEPRN